MIMNLIARILHEHRMDETDHEREAERLQWDYEHAPVDEQRAMDRCCIAICGWSLRTLIAGDQDPDWDPWAREKADLATHGPRAAE
jgi:hypothetical protein